MMKRTDDARMVHKLIAKTAKELAGAYYEIAAGKDPQFYRDFPNQGGFIQQNWKRFILTTREVLTEMLRRPGTTEHMKQEIYEALLLDGNLPYQTMEDQIVNVPH